MDNSKMSVKDMDVFTLKRWIALIDGVNLIYDAAEDNGIDLDDVALKQNHLLRYIDERTERIRIL